MTEIFTDSQTSHLSGVPLGQVASLLLNQQIVRSHSRLIHHESGLARFEHEHVNETDLKRPEIKVRNVKDQRSDVVADLQ